MKKREIDTITGSRYTPKSSDPQKTQQKPTRRILPVSLHTRYMRRVRRIIDAQPVATCNSAKKGESRKVEDEQKMGYKVQQQK